MQAALASLGPNGLANILGADAQFVFFNDNDASNDEEQVLSALLRSGNTTLAQVDTNGDLVISKEELVAGVSPSIATEKARKDQIDYRNAVIDASNAMAAAGISFAATADLDGNGHMNIEDFLELLRSSGKTTLASLDKDRSGTLDQ